MTLDRNSRQLTGFGQTGVLAPPAPERDSIFGDTYGGVPNPNVPMVHGYPTRYHGPIFTVPQAGYQYAPATYIKAPFLGLDGIGDLSQSFTGSQVIDGLIGAFVGYAGAPSAKDAFFYAAAGGLAAGFLGTLGLGALIGVELYQTQKAAHLRPDLPF